SDVRARAFGESIGAEIPAGAPNRPVERRFGVHPPTDPALDLVSDRAAGIRTGQQLDTPFRRNRNGPAHSFELTEHRLAPLLQSLRRSGVRSGAANGPSASRRAPTRRIVVVHHARTR